MTIDYDDLRAKALILQSRDLEIAEFHAMQLPLAAAVLSLLDEIAALKADAERLNWLESCIRDGSYLSILNDIIAVCQHAYATFGTGPALRTAIDGAFAASPPTKE